MAQYEDKIKVTEPSMSEEQFEAYKRQIQATHEIFKNSNTGHTPIVDIPKDCTGEIPYYLKHPFADVSQLKPIPRETTSVDSNQDNFVPPGEYYKDGLASDERPDEDEPGGTAPA